jgi:copper chaperone CopZ
VKKLESVEAVDADMNEHTVTVRFDDEATSVDEIVAALNEAGYTVPAYERQQPAS